MSKNKRIELDRQMDKLENSEGYDWKRSSIGRCQLPSPFWLSGPSISVLSPSRLRRVQSPGRENLLDRIMAWNQPWACPWFSLRSFLGYVDYQLNEHPRSNGLIRLVSVALVFWLLCTSYRREVVDRRDRNKKENNKEDGGGVTIRSL